MKKSCKVFSVFCAVISLTILISGAVISNELPKNFQINANENIEFAYKLPVTGYIETNSDTDRNLCKVDFKLFGVIPIKQATAQVVEKMVVIPSGEIFGIKIFTDGVMVVGMTDIDCDKGLINPAKKAGLKIGDNIISINNKKVTSNEQTANAIEASKGDNVNIIVKRSNILIKISFKPVKSLTEKSYKAGIWVRDSSAGIGTLTFYNPTTNIFAGLGHPICDVDTGLILPVLSGEIVPAQINSVEKGTASKTGELRGSFEEEGVLGKLQTNGETGVYGVLYDPQKLRKAIQVALRQEVKCGPAQIMCSIDNSGVQYFDCIIEKVHFNDSGKTKNMIVKITDPKLLEKTGGIVQGMSGSPIIQNGKLIGAVTHVFVGDSKRGYAIFAENMYNTSEAIEKSLKNVS